MDNIRYFVRLSISEKLSEIRISDVFDIVDENAFVDEIESYDKDGQLLGKTSISVHVDGSNYVYEIPLKQAITPEEGNTISLELAEVLTTDFEFDATVDNNGT